MDHSEHIARLEAEVARLRALLNLGPNEDIDANGVHICTKCGEPVGWCARHACTGHPG